jgi:hypothetical protein
LFMKELLGTNSTFTTWPSVRAISL